jgi:hypothetical protein
MVELKIDMIPQPAPRWLAERRILRLLVVEPEHATLFEALSGGSVFGAIGSEITFEAPLSVFGGHFAADDLLFDEMRVEVEGCASWFGIHGFKSFEGLASGSEGLTINYQHVKTRFWDLGKGWSFGYGANMDLRRDRHPAEALHIEERPVITVKASQKSRFDDLLRVASKALAFIEFATDESVLIERVHVQRGDLGDESFEIGASWKQEPRKGKPSTLWHFVYPIVEQNFGEHLQKWFELYDALPLALDLYRICKRTSGLQVEFRFFSIVSALESLHRSLFGGAKGKGRMNLEQRLQEIVRRHEDCIQDLLPAEACGRVAATRNYLAHQTPDLAKRAFDAKEWFFWYRRLAMVFEICILAELPFQHPDALKNINASRWNAIRSGMLGEWEFTKQ